MQPPRMDITRFGANARDPASSAPDTPTAPRATSSPEPSAASGAASARPATADSGASSHARSATYRGVRSKPRSSRTTRTSPAAHDRSAGSACASGMA
ncbi:hypothetical protein AB4Z54_16120, partial [Streptomyces sp. MCAF7]